MSLKSLFFSLFCVFLITTTSVSACEPPANYLDVQSGTVVTVSKYDGTVWYTHENIDANSFEFLATNIWFQKIFKDKNFVYIGYKEVPILDASSFQINTSFNDELKSIKPGEEKAIAVGSDKFGSYYYMIDTKVVEDLGSCNVGYPIVGKYYDFSPSMKLSLKNTYGTLLQKYSKPRLHQILFSIQRKLTEQELISTPSHKDALLLQTVQSLLSMM